MKSFAIRFSLVAALLCFTFLPNAHAVVLTGIPESGLPHFTNTAQVNLFNLGGNYLLAATNSGAPVTFNSSAGSFSSTPSNPATFLLTALFSSSGGYVPNSGTLTISGSIPYPNPSLSGVYISGDLLTAKLTAFNFDDNNLGFATDMLSGYGTLFGTSESVYLSAAGLGNTLGFTSGALAATTAPILTNAITTVPIPAAVWLLGSALVGAICSGRRTRCPV